MRDAAMALTGHGRSKKTEWKREGEFLAMDHDVHQRSRRFEIPTRTGSTLSPNFSS